MKFSPWGQSSPMWAMHTLILSEGLEIYSVGSHDCVQKLHISLQKDERDLFILSRTPFV